MFVCSNKISVNMAHRLLCVSGVKCGRDGSVDNHMEMGKKLLAAGQLADALSHFHAAVGKCQKHQG